jgi:hypothetical protein
VQYISGEKEVNNNMGFGCGYGWGFHRARARSFLTKEERIEMLKEYYQDELEKEKQGIAERIKELEAS